MLAPCAYVYIIHFRYSLGKDFFENFLFICEVIWAVPSGQGQNRIHPSIGHWLRLDLLKLNSFCRFYAFFVSVFYYVHFGHCISDVDDFKFCIAAC